MICLPFRLMYRHSHTSYLDITIRITTGVHTHIAGFCCMCVGGGGGGGGTKKGFIPFMGVTTVFP